MSEQNQAPIQPQDENQLIAERREKLRALREVQAQGGGVAFPNNFKPAHKAAQLQDCGWVANRWCELLPVPLELKHHLMTLDSPLLRLELVGDVLERLGIAP